MHKAGKAFEENIIKEYKPALISYAWVFILGGILLFAWGLGILFIAGAVIHRNSIKYTITNKRIKTKRGVLGGNITEIGLQDIDNISLRQNFTAKICGYGDILIGTGRMGYKVIIKNIRHPQNIMMLINNLRAGASNNMTSTFDLADDKPTNIRNLPRRAFTIGGWGGFLIILGIIAFAFILSRLVLLFP